MTDVRKYMFDVCFWSEPTSPLCTIIAYGKTMADAAESVRKLGYIYLPHNPKN